MNLLLCVLGPVKGADLSSTPHLNEAETHFGFKGAQWHAIHTQSTVTQSMHETTTWCSKEVPTTAGECSTIR